MVIKCLRTYKNISSTYTQQLFHIIVKHSQRNFTLHRNLALHHKNHNHNKFALSVLFLTEPNNISKTEVRFQLDSKTPLADSYKGQGLLDLSHSMTEH